MNSEQKRNLQYRIVVAERTLRERLHRIMPAPKQTSSYNKKSEFWKTDDGRALRRLRRIQKAWDKKVERENERNKARLNKRIDALVHPAKEAIVFGAAAAALTAVKQLEAVAKQR